MKFFKIFIFDLDDSVNQLAHIQTDQTFRFKSHRSNVSDVSNSRKEKMRDNTNFDKLETISNFTPTTKTIFIKI